MSVTDPEYDGEIVTLKMAVFKAWRMICHAGNRGSQARRRAASRRCTATVRTTSGAPA